MKSIFQFFVLVFAFALSPYAASSQLLGEVESYFKNSGARQILQHFPEMESLPMAQWPQETRQSVYTHLWQQNSAFEATPPIGHPPIGNSDFQPRSWSGIDSSFVVSDGSLRTYIVIYKVQLLEGSTDESFYEFYFLNSAGDLLKSGQF